MTVKSKELQCESISMIPTIGIKVILSQGRNPTTRSKLPNIKIANAQTRPRLLNGEAAPVYTSGPAHKG